MRKSACPACFKVPSPFTYAYSVVVVIFKRRATSAALAFESAIAVIAIIMVARSIFRGRPPRRPRALAAARPACVRSAMSSLSNSALCSAPHKADFGSDTIEKNVREDQLKIIKYNHLIANLMIFHNCHTMTQAFKELEAEGIKLTPELAAAFSPYRTHHANRFGMYELRERDLEPIDYGVTFHM